jgi:hypothetical protein
LTILKGKCFFKFSLFNPVLLKIRLAVKLASIEWICSMIINRYLSCCEVAENDLLMYLNTLKITTLSREERGFKL